MAAKALESGRSGVELYVDRNPARRLGRAERPWVTIGWTLSSARIRADGATVTRSGPGRPPANGTGRSGSGVVVRSGVSSIGERMMLVGHRPALVHLAKADGEAEPL